MKDETQSSELQTAFARPMTIRDWQSFIHKWANDKGWWDPSAEEQKAIHVLVNAGWDEKRAYAVVFGNHIAIKKTALQISEAVEAIEEIRKPGFDPREIYFIDGGMKAPYPVEAVVSGRWKDVPKPEGYPVELGDELIRILDQGEYHGIDLQAVVELKMRYNATRAHRHGGKTV